MDYLSENVSRFKCPKCEAIGETDRWTCSSYDGLCCGDCGEEVKFESERPARWWSVGVYSAGRSYGGAEEGGWWYDTGTLTDEWTVRGFQDMKLAQAYIEELREINKEWKEIRVKGFTEKLPARGFPERTPVYC